MFDKTESEREIYGKLMQQIKNMNSEYNSIRKSSEYRIGTVASVTGSFLKRGKIISLFKTYHDWIHLNRASKVKDVQVKKSLYNQKPNYFSNERIAVYTVIFGKYDRILEPMCTPDNVDYWIITDLDVDLSHSKWKKYDISLFQNDISNMSNIEKNRFFKMHPHLLFENYRYSLYIDGNIQVITDVTEYIYHIGSAGISIHMHRRRDCVYEEAKAVLYLKKESKEAIDKHMMHLVESGFPAHYGLLECNIIMREHTAICKKLMEEWWQEFMNYSHRDQLSLPFVLYKNDINIEDVGTMGNNVMENYSFRLVKHM